MQSSKGALQHAFRYKEFDILKVLAARQHLLLVGVQIKRVLKLGNIRAPLVAEGWVWVDNTVVAEILQSHLVLALSNAVQIPAA